MDSPLNEMISRSQNRVAAVSKVKGSTLSLRQQVIKLVEESNASLPEERRITPRSALIVMDRASAELSSLSKASREYGVLREVNKFISLSSYGITAGGSIKHSDLLPQGHPFSSLNVFASDSVILTKNAEWLSADPKIDDSVRSLVATAFSLPVDSLERKHAFARLSVVKASLVPLHLKSDFVLEALVASFGDGNSSAARRARVALQWRDRYGRWVEMGRGVNFSIRLKDGSIHVVNGVYVGAGGNTRVWMGGRRVGEMSTDTGLVQVSGDARLPDGLYVVGSRNAETFKARIPGKELRKLKLWDQSTESFVDEFSQDIPNIDDMLGTRREAPLGWSKNSDGSFSSDDNYGVVRNSDGSLTAYRLDSNGNRLDNSIGSSSNWSQINDILTKDEPSFDKAIEKINSLKLPLKGINPALDRFNPDVRARIESKYLMEQARKLAVEYHLPENVRIDQDLDQARRGVDSQGNAVPSEWVAQAGERSGVTGWVRFIGSDSNKYPIIANEISDGKFIFGNRSTWNPGSDGSPKQYDSWQAIEKDIPSFVEYLNSGVTKNNPIDFTPITDFGKKDERFGGNEDKHPSVIDEANKKKWDDIKKHVDEMIDGKKPTSTPAQRKTAERKLGKDIYERRIATGDSLDKVAKDLGLTRLEVRRLEAEYGRTLGKSNAPGEPPTPPSGPDSNQPFDMSVAQKFLDERFAEGNIDLIGTTREGRNSYMILNIPGNELQDFKDKSGFDDFGNKDNFTKLPDGTYKLYTDFSELNANLDSPVTGDGPGEPPTPPSGGTPPKTPSPSNPEAPALFNNFDAPTTAFQLRTAEYEPDGRVDETSTDFTDDPKRLATKFTPQDLVAAFSEALIGNSSDSAISEILNANVDDSGDIPSAEDLGNNVDIPQVSIGTPSGAGRLEFNAGEEYVPAGALYNAIWEAGMDPNRVIANIYDSVNGNNNNLDRLIEAQGGVPSPEEAKLVDDITAEIRQIIDATPIGDTSVSVSRDNKAYNLDDKLPGSLIENIPVDFNNPDYYVIDSNHYVPSQLKLDADGYTDNPEYLAHMFNEADLIEQVLISVTDGSGAAYLAFNDLNTYEVPVEAVRDALQYLGVNTNNIIDMLNKESNDFSESDKPVDTAVPEVPTIEPAPTPELKPEPNVVVAPAAPAAPALTYPGPEIPGYSPNNTVLSLDGRVMGAGTRVRANSDGKLGTVISVQNIDSRTGQRIPYVRIRFDDGKVAVRSAVKVRVTDNAAPVVPAMPAPAATPRFIPDIAQRVNAPIVNPAPVASEGNVPGVASLGDTPQDVLPYVNADAVQKDFQAWGARASEIARAGTDRATLASVKKAILDQYTANEEYANGRRNDSLSPEQLQDLVDNNKKTKELVDTLIADAFGVRDGVSFGKGYTLKKTALSTHVNGTPEEIENGTAKVLISISIDINDKNGVKAGTVERNIVGKKVYNLDGTTSFEWQVKNSYMRMNTANKKSGFAFSYNRYMEDWYIANGVKEIHVMAAGGSNFEGAFVWALNGFNWDSSELFSTSLLRKIGRMRNMESNPQVLAHLDNLISRIKEAERPDGTLDANKVPTPMEFALVGWYPDAKSWVGKKFMTDNSWNGVKRLDPAAVEQVQAANYDQMRRARDRVENKVNKANVSRELVMKMNSNDFFDNNEALRPYLAEIRDVLQNNRSLAALSPAAKNALNNYTAKQLLDSSRVMPFEDVIKLRNVLREEYRADNPSLGSNDFGVGNVLSEASPEDIQDDAVSGFTIRPLSYAESGQNMTYKAVHDASGQIFYVKFDEGASHYGLDAVAIEASAGVLVNGLGMIGAYETRQNSNNSDIVIMQMAGSVGPLIEKPVLASSVFEELNDLVASDGSVVSVNSDTLIDKLSSPEEAIRMVLLDLLLSNADRHNGNVLLALDGTDPSKVHILPIDHAIAMLNTMNADTIHITRLLTGQGETIYTMTMPALTRRLKEDELLAMFRNEADSLRESLMKEEKFPTGPELDRIIAKWGSINAFRDVINNRLDEMLKVNGSYHEEFLSMLNNRFWR